MSRDWHFANRVHRERVDEDQTTSQHSTLDDSQTPTFACEPKQDPRLELKNGFARTDITVADDYISVVRMVGGNDGQTHCSYYTPVAGDSRSLDVR